MRKHLKYLFQMLRKIQINETHASDTHFSSVSSCEGFKCAQAFYGCISGAIHVYGMKSKGGVVNVYKEHINEVGIPNKLWRDGSKEPGGTHKGKKEVLKMNRDLYIKDEYSEPHN